jgi:outer membrane biosynthesis protein TonB
MNATVENKRGQKIAKASATAYVLLCVLFMFTLKCEEHEELSNMGIMVNLGTMETGMEEDNTPTAENTEIEEVHTEELVEESVVNNELESLTQDLEATNVSASENATPTNSNTENPANEVEEVVEVPDPGPTVNENALFEGSNSSNQGTGNNPGDQGNPNGNLESDIYGDIAGSGFGGAGDGASLNGRGLVSRPTFSNPTNQFGKVVIKITVNKSGKVVKAELVSLYSTNTNQALVNYAISEAYKFKFNNVSSDTKARDNQVGKIIYNFTAN